MIWQDHQNLVRLASLPLDRVESKHFRWHAEVTGDGSEFRSLAGKSNVFSDGLSRNAINKDEMARMSELSEVRRLVRDFNADEFNDEEPVSRGVSILSETLNPVPVPLAPQSLENSSGFARLPWPASSASVAGSSFCGFSGRTGDASHLKVLLLEPYLITSRVEAQRKLWEKELQDSCGVPVILELAGPSYPDPGGEASFWIKIQARGDAQAKRELRKQVQTGIVTALRAAERVYPQVILGIEQGGVIAAALSQVKAVEEACRSRCCTAGEAKSFRALYRQFQLIAINEPSSVEVVVSHCPF